MELAEAIESVSGDFGPDDAKALRSAMSAKYLQRALREMLREADAQASGLAVADLISEEGRLKALKVQGKVEGIRRAFDRLIELCDVVEEKDTDNG